MVLTKTAPFPGFLSQSSEEKWPKTTPFPEKITTGMHPQKGYSFDGGGGGGGGGGKLSNEERNRMTPAKILTWHSKQFLTLSDIVLSVDRQLFKLSSVSRASLPSRHRHILNIHVLQDILTGYQRNRSNELALRCTSLMSIPMSTWHTHTQHSNHITPTNF